jgi:hypothetical protein
LLLVKVHWDLLEERFRVLLRALFVVLPLLDKQLLVALFVLDKQLLVALFVLDKQ